MRGGLLPPALLAAAFGFALAFAPRGVRWPSLGVFVAAALGVRAARLPAAWEETIFLGLWTSAILTALLVHLPRGVPAPLALGAGANAGLWVGAVTGIAGGPRDLLLALPFALLFLPGAWLARRNLGIAVKVAASWVVAVAVLAAMLPLTPTPGYKPDHME